MCVAYKRNCFRGDQRLQSWRKSFFADGTNKEREFIGGAVNPRRRERGTLGDSSQAPNAAHNFYVISFLLRKRELQSYGVRVRLWSRKRDDCKVGAAVKRRAYLDPTCLHSDPEGSSSRRNWFDGYRDRVSSYLPLVGCLAFARVSLHQQRVRPRRRHYHHHRCHPRF